MSFSLSLSLPLSLPLSKNLASDRAAIILHDTNMPPSLEYHKKDGTKGVSWDNKRGVARAVEEFVGMPFNEEAWYVTHTNTHTHGIRRVALHVPLKSSWACPSMKKFNAREKESERECASERASEGGGREEER